MSLTDRQHAILRGLAAGLRMKQIAGELDVTESTVKAHACYAYRKLGARNKTQAVAIAVRAGIV